MLIREHRRIVYENKWMRVCEDQIRRTDGSAGIYGVVDKPDFALIVPYDGERYWLVEQYRYPVEGRYWELPQGSLEGHEAEAIEVARRELKEETGLLANKIEHVGHLFGAYGYSTQGFDVFFATELVVGDAEPTLEEQDMRVGRFSPQELNEAILNGKIKDAPTLAALALSRVRLGTNWEGGSRLG